MFLKKKMIAALSLALLFCVAATAQEISLSDATNLYKTKTRSRVSVHDPSIVHSTGQTYYVFGSHRALARSTDNMVSWQGVDNSQLFGKTVNGRTQACSYNDAFLVNETKRVTTLVNGAPTEVDFGNFDATEWAKADDEAWVLGTQFGGNMWAPDVLYNPNSGKWMMYLSINGDKWHSVIILLTADKITGPYVYQGPVCYSGFRNSTNSYINWKKTDLELVIGQQTSLPARYNVNDDWGSRWPNNIDPCVFFDEDGELWMAYGSWSGGIFMLKMDKQSGLRDYTVTYPIENDNKGRALSDPYFGKRIAGGYYSSGEGPYIRHIGEYYYLFISYGFFDPDGGYEMRTFRSKKPDGPYLDATNHDACYHDRYWLNYGPNAQTNGGMKLLGSYNGWGFQTVGECAQGHNSAIVDEEGRAFVIYHTKFNDGTAGHEVRTRQLFLNKNGWLCAAPFQFDGETETDATIAQGCRFSKDEITGTYEVLIHKYKMDYENMEEVTPIYVTLTSEGKVTGDLSGSWSMTEGTAYIHLNAGGVAYDGVVVEQTIDETTLKAVAFTATANSGVAIWGYKATPACAVAYTVKTYTEPVKANQSVSRHLALYGDARWGTTINWTSSAPDVITNDGLYNPTDEITSIDLTLHIVNGSCYYEKVFNVKALAATEPAGDYRSGIVAYYDFDQKPTLNLYNENQRATYAKLGSGTLPTLEAVPGRVGQVVHQNFGTSANVSYTRFDNPLKDAEELTGFTISMWVKRADDNQWDALWAFTDRVGTMSSVKQRLFLTGNAYIGFKDDDAATYFDINNPNEAPSTNYIPVGEWTYVTVVASATGVSFYRNGTLCSPKKFTAPDGVNARNYNFQQVLNFIKTAGYLQLGAGSFWGSAEAWMDDLIIYNRALPSTDIRALYTMETRVTDFSPSAEPDAITQPRMTEQAPTAIYDLSGRLVAPSARTTRLAPGIYVINGRKVVIR